MAVGRDGYGARLSGSKPGTWLTLLSEEMVDTLLKLRGSELSDGMLGSDAVEREQYDGPSGSTDSGSPGRPQYFSARRNLRGFPQHRVQVARAVCGRRRRRTCQPQPCPLAFALPAKPGGDCRYRRCTATLEVGAAQAPRETERSASRDSVAC